MSDERKKRRSSPGGGRRYNRERFAATAMLMLQGGIEPRFLWEAMFQADMEAYRLTGKSITGATWIKTWRGVEPKRPVPRSLKEKSA